jgi:hypothetical protein
MPSWITLIDKDNIELVKKFLKAGNVMNNLLTSNEPAYIRHYSLIFEDLWRNGIDALDRIKDIEAGVHLSDIEVIPNSVRTQEL